MPLATPASGCQDSVGGSEAGRLRAAIWHRLASEVVNQPRETAQTLHPREQRHSVTVFVRAELALHCGFEDETVEVVLEFFPSRFLSSPSHRSIIHCRRV